MRVLVNLAGSWVELKNYDWIDGVRKPEFSLENCKSEYVEVNNEGIIFHVHRSQIQIIE